MILLALLLVGMACLLLWFVIGSSGMWAIKLALIIAFPLFSVFTWKQLAAFQGWPSGQSPPRVAQFQWGIVDEPDPARGNKGAIYVWLSTDAHDGQPRAYKLPYSRQLHRQVMGADGAVRKGVTVEARRRSAKKGSGSTIPKWAFRRYILPNPGQPKLP